MKIKKFDKIKGFGCFMLCKLNRKKVLHISTAEHPHINDKYKNFGYKLKNTILHQGKKFNFAFSEKLNFRVK